MRALTALTTFVLLTGCAQPQIAQGPTSVAAIPGNPNKPAPRAHFSTVQILPQSHYIYGADPDGKPFIVSFGKSDDGQTNIYLDSIGEDEIVAMKLGKWVTKDGRLVQFWTGSGLKGQTPGFEGAENVFTLGDGAAPCAFLSSGDWNCFGVKMTNGRPNAYNKELTQLAEVAAAPDVDLKEVVAPNCALFTDESLWCVLKKNPVQLATGVETVSLYEGDRGRWGCFSNTDGEVWCWGDNRLGQFGQGTRAETPDHTYTAVRVEGIPPMRQVATSVGSGAVCALSWSDEVWCWGGNSHLQARPEGPRIDEAANVCEVDQAATEAERRRIEAPCPPSGPNGDNPCERAKWNAQRMGVGAGPVYKRVDGCLLPPQVPAAVMKPAKIAGLSNVLAFDLGNHGLGVALHHDGSLSLWGARLLTSDDERPRGVRRLDFPPVHETTRPMDFPKSP